MTRNTILKMPAIIRRETTKVFTLGQRVKQELAVDGETYQITLKKNKDESCYNPFVQFDELSNQCSFVSSHGSLGFTTLQEAKDFVNNILFGEKEQNIIKINHYTKKNVYIVGSFIEYTCTYPKQKTTYNKTKALSWYKNYRIIKDGWSSYICFDINPGKNKKYIDISLYEYDSTTKKFIDVMMSPSYYNQGATPIPYVFRLGLDRKVIGVVLPNGKLQSKDLWNLSWNNNSGKYDLSYTDITAGNGLFADNTLMMLNQLGFKTIDWTSNWGMSERPIRINTLSKLCSTRTYSDCLKTNRSKEICEFLKDIPFDEEHCVVKFKNGYIARFGKLAQAWSAHSYYYTGHVRHRGQLKENEINPISCDVDNSPYDYYDETNKERLYKGVLIEEHFVESVRLWISNNFDIRSVVVSKCCGEKWESTRIDSCDNRWSDESNFSPSNPIYTELDIDLEKFNKTVYEKLFKSHPRLKYLIGYTDRHPTLYKGDDIKFLRALFDYQKVIETFISLGMDDMFWRSSSSRRGEDAECFNFNDFIDDMKLKEIPHKASSDFYQILGLNKAQFKLIFKDPDLSYNKIMSVLYRINWERLIPNFPTDGWMAEDHRQRAAYPLIPVQYIELIIKTIKGQTTDRTSSGYNTYDIANKINNFVGYGFDLKAIYKYLCIKRVDAQLYYDYLRMRDELERNSTTSHFDPHLWDKKLDDADDVHFTHDRMVFVYNQWSAECARYRCLGDAEKEKKRQELYDERYKTLKSFNYHEKEDSRSIVVPEKLMEIIVEGQVLHHCVGSFVESVSEGRDTIVFLRNKAMPDVPYATVSLRYDTVAKEWYIDQAHTAHNGDITEEDVEFLKHWGLKNRVKQSTIQTHYGAKCHH